jgi:phosphate:Na+ symporter
MVGYWIETVLFMVAAIGALLLGFEILSSNITKLFHTQLKKLFNKTSKNNLIGVGIGAAATAIMQSSGATTVMVVGFVNTGIINLVQATALIMGANIGTTITAQLAALSSFDFGAYAIALAGIGAFIAMLAKKERTKTIGNALAGFGILFLGLECMSLAIKSELDGVPVVKEAITAILSSDIVSNGSAAPFILFALGIVLTALVQSSSLITTIVISLTGAGIIIGAGSEATSLTNNVLFLILGSNIGSCVTALMSSLGAQTSAKRASVIHLLFNTFGSVIFFIVLLLWPSFMEDTFLAWFPGAPGTQIAMFHTFFNVLFTLLFCPFINVFVFIATKVIPDKKEESHTTFIDERFLSTPAVALTQVTKEVARMGRLSIETLNEGIDAFIAHDMGKTPEIHEKIKLIDKINEKIVAYLVKISTHLGTNKDEEFLAILHNSVNDLYRSVEIADNMTKYTRHLVEDQLVFSQGVFEKITLFKEKINTQYSLIERVLLEKEYNLLDEIDKLEDEMDAMRSKLIKDHIVRLEKGECSLSSSSVFINLVSNLERAGDHLHVIAHSIVENN